MPPAAISTLSTDSRAFSFLLYSACEAMPDSFITVYVVPRYEFRLGNRVLYGTMSTCQACNVQPMRDAGCYALESTAAQNFYAYRVYSSDMPYVVFRPDYRWRLEADALAMYPMFRPLLQRLLTDNPSRTRDGVQAVPMLLDVVCGLARKTMYILTDYSGSIDAWVSDQTMVPGVYAHFRLDGVNAMENWWLCQQPRFLGYVIGESASVASRV